MAATCWSFEVIPAAADLTTARTLTTEYLPTIKRPNFFLDITLHVVVYGHPVHNIRDKKLMVSKTGAQRNE